jgi:hypothetical protein
MDMNLTRRFNCPWGCAEDLARADPTDHTHQDWTHSNAWDCPKFAQKFLGAVQAIAQKLEKVNP